MDRERYKPYERPADRNNVASTYRQRVKMKKYLSILETKHLKLKVSLSSPSSRRMHSIPHNFPQKFFNHLF